MHRAAAEEVTGPQRSRRGKAEQAAGAGHALRL
jgi:hypothetical protein